MQFRKTIRITFLALGLTTLTAQAQDLMVNAPKIDKKLRTVDSLALMRMKQVESLEDPAGDLYQSWTNAYVHYDISKPKEYKIDLRRFHMPCDSRVVTSHYGYRRSFRRNHYGTDIKVYVGDTIRAAFSGKIRVVADQGRYTGYGKYIIIRHANGLETVYGHLSKHLIKENMTVKAGDPIGLGGSTGRSTGPHLHFETRFLGEFINPEKLFAFESQDVRGDYYIFRSSGKGALVNERTIVGGEDVAEVEETEKTAESQAFQQQRKERANRSMVHKVKKGETLSTIARKYHTTVSKLCSMNHISKNKTLRPGQIIKCS
ncbi:MAG: peptidoglycan DD-metalloendopeptidase family protein [Bacteroidaceae bacterium]|nr:peptidoglycan DD-metalloendopeptidase family protein [Bacteroidaceae bacterium]